MAVLRDIGSHCLRALAVAALIATVLVGSPGRAPAEENGRPLAMALMASESQHEIEARWSPLLQDLGRRLGTSVVADIHADYSRAVWGLRSGQDQLAWLGNEAAIKAVDHAGAEVFAQQSLSSAGGDYFSCLVVNADSPFHSAEEVIDRAAGLTLARGDANSTSGTVIPDYYLFARRGTDAGHLFRRLVQGTHEANIFAVAEGRADAATISSRILDMVRRDHPETAARVRVVWRSPVIPGNPLLWRKDLPEAVKTSIRAFFVDYGKATPGKSPARLAEEQANLDRLGFFGFAASDDRQLLPVRRVEVGLKLEPAPPP